MPINELTSSEPSRSVSEPKKIVDTTKGVPSVVATMKSVVTPEKLNALTKNGTDTRIVFDQEFSSFMIDSDTPVLTPASPNMASTEDAVAKVAVDDTRMIGQQLWHIKVGLFNHAQPMFLLSPNPIIKLMIEDDILSWPLRGYIIVDNRMEGLERGLPGNPFYHIRSDARDEIFIQIWPENGTKGDLPDDIWKITAHCVIYDVEDLPAETSKNKAKKLYFWDKRFQMIQERKMFWSTATGTRKDWFRTPTIKAPVAHLGDEERSMYTGDAIASLLIDVGYEEFIDKDNWDSGAGKIFFTNKTNDTVKDSIDYILSHHVSQEKKDICQLMWNRAIEKLQLVPMHKLYEKAGKGSPGELQIEHMFFGGFAWDGDDSNAINTSPFKAPLSDAPDLKRDIKTSYGAISKYRFSQTSGLDNSKTFVSKPIYSHWNRKKQFQCDIKENEIVEVKDFIKKNYTFNMLHNVNFPIMALNKTKTDELVVQASFSPVSQLDPKEDRYIRSLDGKGDTLYASIFLNQCMIIYIKGSTHRLAGTFIAIDRISETSDTNYDYQICGQYFVVNVKHVLQQGVYINELTLVKIHAYDKLLNNEDVF